MTEFSPHKGEGFVARNFRSKRISLSAFSIGKENHPTALESKSVLFLKGFNPPEVTDSCPALQAQANSDDCGGTQKSLSR